MEEGASLYEWIWHSDFWLPGNVTWADLKSDDTTFIPTTYDLLIPIPLAFGLFFIRLIWER